MAATASRDCRPPETAVIAHLAAMTISQAVNSYVPSFPKAILSFTCSVETKAAHGTLICVAFAECQLLISQELAVDLVRYKLKLWPKALGRSIVLWKKLDSVWLYLGGYWICIA